MIWYKALNGIFILNMLYIYIYTHQSSSASPMPQLGHHRTCRWPTGTVLVINLDLFLRSFSRIQRFRVSFLKQMVSIKMDIESLQNLAAHRVSNSNTSSCNTSQWPYTVKCRYNAVQCCIHHCRGWCKVLLCINHSQNLQNTYYIFVYIYKIRKICILRGLGEKWSRYNGIARYIDTDNQPVTHQNIRST